MSTTEQTPAQLLVRIAELEADVAQLQEDRTHFFHCFVTMADEMIARDRSGLLRLIEDSEWMSEKEKAGFIGYVEDTSSP
jgi:hypothetical protein